MSTPGPGASYSSSTKICLAPSNPPQMVAPMAPAPAQPRAPMHAPAPAQPHTPAYGPTQSQPHAPNYAPAPAQTHTPNYAPTHAPAQTHAPGYGPARAPGSTPARAPTRTRIRAQPRAPAPQPAPQPAPMITPASHEPEPSTTTTTPQMREQTQFLPLDQKQERPYPVQNPPAIDFKIVPPQILKVYQKRFDAIDLNKDGIVSLREIATVGKVFGYKLTKSELSEIFGKSDIDDSGTITFDEFVKALWDRANKSKSIAPIRQKFRQFDRYGRGYITSDDAYPILRDELGFDMNKTESLIDMYDKNRDYRLSIQEFTEFYQKVEELKTEITRAFQEWDRDGDGYVTFYEAQAVMGPKGFSAEDIQVMIDKYDEDRDGKLNYPEFARFWDIPLFS